MMIGSCTAESAEINDYSFSHPRQTPAHIEIDFIIHRTDKKFPRIKIRGNNILKIDQRRGTCVLDAFDARLIVDQIVFRIQIIPQNPLKVDTGKLAEEILFQILLNITDNANLKS